MFERCNWLNEPQEWHLEGGILDAVTDHKTDFWRETHYGFIRDSGHFYSYETSGDFTAELRVRARYDELYDQAGIMVRLDHAHWVKAGLEMSDGSARLSSVLTVGQSDWATGAYNHDPTDYWIRATVAAGVLRLQASADGKTWPLVRLSPFPRAPAYAVGPVCCTPERSGLQVRFSDFRVGPPSGKELHDMS
jgi:regulation of enolase protein 1 (concanavalin A-like superfamily)